MSVDVLVSRILRCLSSECHFHWLQTGCLNSACHFIHSNLPLLQRWENLLAAIQHHLLRPQSPNVEHFLGFYSNLFSSQVKWRSLIHSGSEDTQLVPAGSELLHSCQVGHCLPLLGVLLVSVDIRDAYLHILSLLLYQRYLCIYFDCLALPVFFSLFFGLSFSLKVSGSCVLFYFRLLQLGTDPPRKECGMVL